MNAKDIGQVLPEAVAPTVKRRNWVLGAGAIGAAALAVKALPAGAPLAPPAEAAPPQLPDTAGGYRLSAHVQRYYETARS